VVSQISEGDNMENMTAVKEKRSDVIVLGEKLLDSLGATSTCDALAALDIAKTIIIAETGRAASPDCPR
jgi:hypothetical protein